jgi:hypothetical protein
MADATLDQVLDTDTTNGAGTPPPAGHDAAAGNAGVAGNGKDSAHTAADLVALNERLLAQKRAANREAVEAKKRAEALEAKVKAYEDAQKTEAEKLQAAAAAAAKRAEAAEQRARILEHQTHAADAGVLGQYRKFAVSALTEQLEADPDTDPVEFFKALKSSHPAMYETPKGAAARTAGGSPPEPGRTSDLDRQIKEHEEALAAERDANTKYFLKRSLRVLREKKAAEPKGA